MQSDTKTPKKIPPIVEELKAEEQAGRLYHHPPQPSLPPTPEPTLHTPPPTTSHHTTPLPPTTPPTPSLPLTEGLQTTITPILFTTLNGTILYANTATQKTLGYTTPELTTLTLDTLLKTKTKTPLTTHLHTTTTWTGEATATKKNKTTLPLHLTATRLTHHLIITLTDLTPYKNQLKDLTDTHRRLTTILDHTHTILYRINLKKQTLDYITPNTHTILGLTPDELHTWTTHTLLDHIHPDDRATIRAYITHHTTTPPSNHTPHACEFRFTKNNKDYRWLTTTLTTHYDTHHQPHALTGTLEDTTEHHKTWDDLAKSEERYRILAETSADGVFTTDALGCITYLNPAFQRLLGHPKDKILNTPLRTYLLEDSIYFLQQLLLDIHKTNEKIENIELELIAADNTIIPIEVNMAPLMKTTEFQGVVCTVRDIVQRREIEAELRKNERLKTEFMNIAAHELRSPVTPIKGYLDLILHDPDTNDKIKNWAKISLRNADRLLKLVNDILDVARLDSDTMRFDMEKLNTTELLTEVAEDVKPAITAKHLTFTLTIPPDTPYILADKNRLSQVMKNLIGNALKFTDTGSITLTAQRTDKNLTITVQDTGIGISKEELKKIFTKFYQAYTGEDRNNEGTGLGLFISKEIIKKHNGRIWAESEVGKGSSFIIELPYIHKMTVDFHPQSTDHAQPTT